MIVKTVGSDSKCDVVINDPSVSSFHLQLVRRDDGMTSVTDMGSEEGTFVNGNQIDAEIILHPGDNLKAGQIEVDWEKQLAERKKGAVGKWILFGILAIIVSTALFFMVMALKNNPSQKAVLYEGVYPKSQLISFVDNGKQHEAEVVKGQVVLVFDPTVNHDQVVQLLESPSVTICAQVPRFRYYLVQTEEGKEAALMDSVGQLAKVIYMGRNFIHDFKAPKVAFLERYENLPDRISHGEMVQQLIEEGSGHAHLSIRNKDAIYGMNSASIMEFCAAELDRSSKRQLLLFNMSFGPQAPVVTSWEEMSEDERSNYRYLYYKELDCLLALAKNSDKENYLFVKAMGNEGICSFDRVILDSYLKGLDEKTRKVFESHFILVSASDNRFHVGLPNTLSNSCLYSNAVTIDLSGREVDYKGTSAAAALLTGWLAGLSERYGLNASECLTVTIAVADESAHDGRLVSLEMLEEKCKVLFPDRQNRTFLDQKTGHSKHKEVEKNVERDQKKRHKEHKVHKKNQDIKMV